jgi:hypothetical protein
VTSRLFFGKSQLLIGGTLAALVWANLAHTPTPFEHASTSGQRHRHVFFFAIAAKEVFEATLPGGPLSSMKTVDCRCSAAGGWLGPRRRSAARVEVGPPNSSTAGPSVRDRHRVQRAHRAPSSPGIRRSRFS